MAGYHEIAATRESLPFIADDIMETFDDFRAEEAFRLFAEMAEVGQVIYLTHHQHLCDMAQRIHPAVRIHDLTAPRPKQRQAARTFVAASAVAPIEAPESDRTVPIRRRG